MPVSPWYCCTLYCQRALPSRWQVQCNWTNWQWLQSKQRNQATPAKTTFLSSAQPWRLLYFSTHKHTKHKEKCVNRSFGSQLHANKHTTSQFEMKLNWKFHPPPWKTLLSVIGVSFSSSHHASLCHVMLFASLIKLVDHSSWDRTLTLARSVTWFSWIGSLGEYFPLTFKRAWKKYKRLRVFVSVQEREKVRQVQVYNEQCDQETRREEKFFSQ